MKTRTYNYQLHRKGKGENGSCRVSWLLDIDYGNGKKSNFIQCGKWFMSYRQAHKFLKSKGVTV